MKNRIIIIFILLFCKTAFAQNDPQFSLGSFNKLVYNPAAIAQSDYVDIRLSAREQWVGFEDAPATQSVSISNYFRDWRMGLGLTVINDVLGVENIQNIKAKYVYHAWFAEDHYISMGLGAGVMMKSFSSAGLIFDDPADDHITDGDLFKARPDFDLGMEWHLKDFFLGASANHITQNTDDFDVLKVPRHYYAYAGYRWHVSSRVAFRPSVSVLKIENIHSVTGEWNMNYDDTFWLSIGYRAEDAWILSSRIMVFDNLIASYAYDMGAGEFSSYRDGSHEVMLHFRISKPEKEYRSPRFFD